MRETQNIHADIRLIAISGWLVLITSSIILSLSWSLTSAALWLFQSGLLWYFVIYSATKRIWLNRPQTDLPLYSDIGWANRLTLLRGLFVSMTGGFLFQPWPTHTIMWLPGILYMLAAILDRVDGYAARKSNRTSLMGIELDTVFDALGLAVAPLLAVGYGQVHWSYLLFSSAYYLFQWGMYHRRQAGLPVYSLSPNILRRAWAGFQMGFIAVALLPVFRPPVTTVAGFAFLIPVLTGFFIDWLTVSGRLDSNNVAIKAGFIKMESYSYKLILPLLRIIIISLIVYLVQSPGTLQENVMLLTAVLLLAGVLARVAALVLIGVSGFYFMSHPMNLAGVCLMVSTIWILLLGTGRFSLWKWDEEWVNRYDGA